MMVLGQIGSGGFLITRGKVRGFGFRVGSRGFLIFRGKVRGFDPNVVKMRVLGVPGRLFIIFRGKVRGFERV
jgi:hypothetical protein